MNSQNRRNNHYRSYPFCWLHVKEWNVFSNYVWFIFLTNDLQSCDKILEDIEILKLRLKNIFHEKTQWQLSIRSCTKYFEDGGKKSRFFLNLEKRQSSNKTIHRLQLSVNTITQDPHKILFKQRLFYKSLYTKTQHLHISEFIANLQIPKIPENIKENMESNISKAESHATLKTMENNKSPGEDGYPAEFYKVFWIDIKDMLLNSLAPGRPRCHFKTAIFNPVLLIGSFTSSKYIALRWMPRTSPMISQHWFR